MDEGHHCKTKETPRVPGWLSRSWCSAAGFLGLCQDSAGWSCRTPPGQRPLSIQHSLQLQGIHIFLHPPGIGVSTDLPLLPGDEPVKSSREVLQAQREKGAPWACGWLACHVLVGQGVCNGLVTAGRSCCLHRELLPQLIPSTRMLQGDQGENLFLR